MFDKNFIKIENEEDKKFIKINIGKSIYSNIKIFNIDYFNKFLKLANGVIKIGDYDKSPILSESSDNLTLLMPWFFKDYNERNDEEFQEIETGTNKNYRPKKI
jgi:hypothetical protein